jgi:hypothetical protein
LGRKTDRRAFRRLICWAQQTPKTFSVLLQGDRRSGPGAGCVSLLRRRRNAGPRRSEKNPSRICPNPKCIGRCQCLGGSWGDEETAAGGCKTRACLACRHLLRFPLMGRSLSDKANRDILLTPAVPRVSHRHPEWQHPLACLLHCPAPPSVVAPDQWRGLRPRRAGGFGVHWLRREASYLPVTGPHRGCWVRRRPGQGKPSEGSQIDAAPPG